MSSWIFHSVCGLMLWYVWSVDAERTIADIEKLERIYALPDARPLTANDLEAANRRHDRALASSPWFRLWQSYGICCRAEPAEYPLGTQD